MNEVTVAKVENGYTVTFYSGKHNLNVTTYIYEQLEPALHAVRKAMGEV